MPVEFAPVKWRLMSLPLHDRREARRQPRHPFTRRTREPSARFPQAESIGLPLAEQFSASPQPHGGGGLALACGPSDEWSFHPSTSVPSVPALPAGAVEET